MPSALAFSAINLPTAAAASTLPPDLTDLRNAGSTVDALARTLAPLASITCAYMCEFERCTARRTTRSSAILRRVCLERRKRACSLAVSYTHLRAHETGRNLVCRLLL